MHVNLEKFVTSNNQQISGEQRATARLVCLEFTYAYELCGIIASKPL